MTTLTIVITKFTNINIENGTEGSSYYGIRIFDSNENSYDNYEYTLEELLELQKTNKLIQHLKEYSNHQVRRMIMVAEATGQSIEVL
jgi:hypothetical protein